MMLKICDQYLKPRDSNTALLARSQYGENANLAVDDWRYRWLSAKNWLAHKKTKVVLASRRRWKMYWVVLRGTRLFFHVDVSQPQTDEHNVILATTLTEFDLSVAEQVVGTVWCVARWWRRFVFFMLC